MNKMKNVKQPWTYLRALESALGWLEVGAPNVAADQLKEWSDRPDATGEQKAFLLKVRHLCYSSSPRQADYPLADEIRRLS